MNARERVSFCYVVQVDMPGLPIKVGHSGRVHSRFKSFLTQTPADMRLIGATIHGYDREILLKRALAPSIIRGEWGHPNADVQALLDEWFAAGEWYVPAADRAAAYEAHGVTERLRLINARRTGQSWLECFWAPDVLKSVEHLDPLLGLHWDGFVQAPSRPLLAGIPALERAA